VNGKIDPTIKINKNIDSMFQGIDILGGDQTTSKLKDGLMLKMKIGSNDNIFKVVNGGWTHKQKDGTFGKIDPNDKKGKEIINQLIALVNKGQDDTVQIQKDEEEAAKLKKDDKEKASAEKEKTADIEKTKSAADATRATAKPNKGKDIAKPGDKNIGFGKSKYEESFKSDYKNYF
jgi:hypothetical protein